MARLLAFVTVMLISIILLFSTTNSRQPVFNGLLGEILFEPHEGEEWDKVARFGLHSENKMNGATNMKTIIIKKLGVSHGGIFGFRMPSGMIPTAIRVEIEFEEVYYGSYYKTHKLVYELKESTLAVHIPLAIAKDKLGLMCRPEIYLVPDHYKFEKKLRCNMGEPGEGSLLTLGVHVTPFDIGGVPPIYYYCDANLRPVFEMSVMELCRPQYSEYIDSKSVDLSFITKNVTIYYRAQGDDISEYYAILATTQQWFELYKSVGLQLPLPETICGSAKCKYFYDCVWPDRQHHAGCSYSCEPVNEKGKQSKEWWKCPASSELELFALERVLEHYTRQRLYFTYGTSPIILRCPNVLREGYVLNTKELNNQIKWYPYYWQTDAYGYNSSFSGDPAGVVNSYLIPLNTTHQLLHSFLVVNSDERSVGYICVDSGNDYKILKHFYMDYVDAEFECHLTVSGQSYNGSEKIYLERHPGLGPFISLQCPCDKSLFPKHMEKDTLVSYIKRRKIQLPPEYCFPSIQIDHNGRSIFRSDATGKRLYNKEFLRISVFVTKEVAVRLDMSFSLRNASKQQIRSHSGIYTLLAGQLNDNAAMSPLFEFDIASVKHDFAYLSRKSNYLINKFGYLANTVTPKKQTTRPSGNVAEVVKHFGKTPKWRDPNFEYKGYYDEYYNTDIL